MGRKRRKAAQRSVSDSRRPGRSTGGQGRHGLPHGLEDGSGSDGDGLGTIRIGGVLLRVDGSGNVHRAARQAAGVQRRRVGQPQDLPRDPYAAAFTSDDGEGGGQGRRRGGGHGVQRGGAPSSSPDEDEDEDEDEEMDIEAALDDYLANVGVGLANSSGELEEEAAAAAAAPGAAKEEGAGAEGASGGEAEGSEGEEESEEGGEEREEDSKGAARARERRHFEVLRRFSAFDVGDEGPVGGRGWDTGSSSSGDFSDEETSGSGSDSEEEESGSGGEEAGGGLLTAEELEGLSLAQRFPVQARPAPPPLPGQAREGKKKKGRPGVKGAMGGKLAPGEKARLRRERIEAKRAARASARGFDLAWVNHQLQDMVDRGLDIQALPAMGKVEARAVQRLAALYGCRASQQGGSSKKRVTVVAATQHTAVPRGEALLAVGSLLAAQFEAERAGAAADRRLAVPGADYASKQVLTGNARWAGLRGSRGKKAGAGAASGGEEGARLGGGGGEHKMARGSRIRPVAFVSRGTINPEDDALEVVCAAGAPGAGAETAATAAAVEGPGWQLQQRQEEVSEGADEGAGEGAGGVAAAVAMLEVVEDRGSGGGSLARLGELVEAEEVEIQVEVEGSEGDSEEEREEEEAHPGLGSAGGAPLYTRLTSVPLGSGGGSLRGALAAEGISNPGRLLGLGLALGIGSEVFGAPGCSQGIGAGAAPPADLSPLSPLLSKSAQRRMRRASGGGAGAAALSPAELASASQAAQRDAGRKGRPGRSKQERKRQGQGEQEAQQAEVEEADETEAAAGAPVNGGLGSGGLVAGDFGDFERHTTGIGSRLMMQMGWQGTGAGLGRRQHGIAEPIAAEKRGKRVGLGAERVF